VIPTYAAALAVCLSSLALGQAALALCGVRRWSWLSPAVGLALLAAVCWATVRLPGNGLMSATVVLVLTAIAITLLRNRVGGGREALGAGLPVAVVALLAASLPFAVEGHFGILGTGFNPDMSQHLLATDRLIHGAGSPLLHQGYPLGPHAIVAALNKGLGIGIVQSFDGLMVAVAILAPLTALAVFEKLPPLQRTAAALLVGLPYLVASYYAQGAFKETIQALLVLAFVLSLRESTHTWHQLPLRLVPAALIAIGSVYTYSFPGLIWPAAIAVIWTVLEWLRRDASPAVGGEAGGFPPPEGCGGEGPVPASAVSRPPEQRVGQGRPPASPSGSAGLGALSLAVLIFLVGTLPELGRMIDFHSFETFDPTGPGLGNLFGQISPFEALGIWLSGDFRLAPGDGVVPAIFYYLGAAFAVALLFYGLKRCRRLHERAILASALAVVLLYVAARLGGTPYTAAKALEIAAPVLTLALLRPLAGSFGAASPAGGAVGGTSREEASAIAGGGGSLAATGPAGLAFLAYVLAAGACSLLAFANAPVGPTSYSPALTGLRPLLAGSSALVLVPEELLDDEHGEPYIAWELRGGRVCIKAASAAGGRAPSGIRFFVTQNTTQMPFRGLHLRRRTWPYAVWERPGATRGPSPCPLIAVRQARSGARP
jgi:hypothetical protein